MNSQQAFEQAILIMIALAAVGGIGAIVSIFLGRRRSWVQSLPSTRIRAYPTGNVPPAKVETADEYNRRTNYGAY